MSFTYKGLSAELTRHTVTEAEVDSQLERLRQENPRITEVDGRPAQSGDEVVLDYAGFCGEEQFAGGTAQNQTLVLGSGMFIPGFEEQLIGKNPGEKVIVKVTFPEVYHSEELAGKDAQFHCVIHKIRVKTPYEADDVFAREVGNCETYAELRQKMAESMQAYADERGEMDLQDRLLRQAAESLEVEIGQEELKQAVEQQMQNLEAQLAQKGLNLEMYCQFLNTTPEQLRADAQPQAVLAIKTQAAVDEIARLEKLEATQEEITEACQVICQQNGLTMEQLQQYYDAQFENAVIRSVLTSKAMGLIRDAANVTVKNDQ